MKIKTNIRAGKGGASGTGQNGNSSSTPDATQAPEASPPNNTVVYYVPPIARCVGI
jgi:hypothetical protein